MGLKEFLGLANEEDQSWQKELEDSCKLSYRNRAIGFGLCLAVGVVLDIIAIISITTIITNPGRFAALYSFGNILTIISTCFVVGFCSQMKNMFKQKRIIATILYLGSIILTLIVAYELNNILLVILCLIFQFLCLVWYILSYIPYARFCVRNSVESMC